MYNRWRSRYGKNVFVSFPSIVEEMKLDYEVITFVEGR